VTTSLNKPWITEVIKVSWNWFSSSRFVTYRQTWRKQYDHFWNYSLRTLRERKCGSIANWVKCFSVGWAVGFRFSAAAEMFLLATSFNVTLGQPINFLCIKWPERKDGHVIQSGAEFQSRWNFISTLCAFMAWFLLHRESLSCNCYYKNSAKFSIWTHEFWTLKLIF
jgi:hypothetical protein